MGMDGGRHLFLPDNRGAPMNNIEFRSRPVELRAEGRQL